MPEEGCMEGWKGLQPRLHLFAEEGKQEAKGVKRWPHQCLTSFPPLPEAIWARSGEEGGVEAP